MVDPGGETHQTSWFISCSSQQRHREVLISDIKSLSPRMPVLWLAPSANLRDASRMGKDGGKPARSRWQKMGRKKKKKSNRKKIKKVIGWTKWGQRFLLSDKSWIFSSSCRNSRWLLGKSFKLATWHGAAWCGMVRHGDQSRSGAAASPTSSFDLDRDTLQSPSCIWVNYTISHTWIKAIWGWFPIFPPFSHHFLIRPGPACNWRGSLDMARSRICSTSTTSKFTTSSGDSASDRHGRSGVTTKILPLPDQNEDSDDEKSAKIINFHQKTSKIIKNHQKSSNFMSYGWDGMRWQILLYMWIFLWINEWMDRHWWKIDGKLMENWWI